MGEGGVSCLRCPPLLAPRLRFMLLSEGASLSSSASIPHPCSHATTALPSTSFCPWDEQARCEHFLPPCPPLKGERELSGSALPSTLVWLQSVNEDLVAQRPLRILVQSEAESLSQEHHTSKGNLLAAQSSLLGVLFLAVGLEMSGPSSKLLWPGHFLL